MTYFFAETMSSDLVALSSTKAMDLTAKAMDVSARSLDLLAIVGRLAQASGTTALLSQEIGRWLGREGLDETELEFFLWTSQSLAMPNERTEVQAYFKTIQNARPHKPVVPLFALPSQSLGKLVARDPLQRWMTSSISCLFRYHDEAFVIDFLSTFLTISIQPAPMPPPRHRLERSAEKLRLDAVVRKVVSSSWLHITNAGLIGSADQCPKLLEEFSWACTDGHNIDSYTLAVLVTKICTERHRKELIIESQHLLTNVLLWLLWHYDGRLRVVVSGKIVYDQVLGPTDSVVEFRVGRFCTATSDGTQCEETAEGERRSFQMFHNISGHFSKIFGGHYDTADSIRQEPWMRQELYTSPFRYTTGPRSIPTMTRMTAKILLQWYLERPVATESIFVGSKLSFRLRLANEGGDWSSDDLGLRIGDLVGRTPRLITDVSGGLGRPYVIFSTPSDESSLLRSRHAPKNGEATSLDTGDFELTDDHRQGLHTVEEDDSLDDDDPLLGTANELLDYFPILYDLVSEMQKTCRCWRCVKQRQRLKHAKLFNDGNCAAFTAFMEVMFLFSHGIADSFGASDASGIGKDAALRDLGAVGILKDAIRWNLFDPSIAEGTVTWHALFDTAARVFLGSPTLSTMTDAVRDYWGAEAHTSFAHRLMSTVVAVQYGSLAVVAPWLDISHPLSLKRCFRFEIARGQIAVSVEEDTNSGYHSKFHQIAADMAVVETQAADSVSDFIKRFPSTVHGPNAEATLLNDHCDKIICDWVLVSVTKERHKLLMRVRAGEHSRMVEPSRAMVQFTRATSVPRCCHESQSETRIETVPAGCTVELNQFDELIGRWTAAGAEGYPPADEESDDGSQPGPLEDEDMEMQSSDDENSGAGGYDGEAQHPRKKLKADLEEAMAADGQNGDDTDDEGDGSAEVPIRASHVLNSPFKLNIALALTGDDPVLIADDSSCFGCALGFARSRIANNGRRNTCRWLINWAKSRQAMVPAYNIQRRRKLQALAEGNL